MNGGDVDSDCGWHLLHDVASLPFSVTDTGPEQAPCRELGLRYPAALTSPSSTLAATIFTLARRSDT
jgi:hypothetical protein